MIERLKFLFSLVFFYQKKKTQIVAFIKTDNIGDYILFRNFLPYTRKSPKYASHRLVLIGNSAWKELAESMDKEYIDVFFWINTALYAQNKWYRIKILWALRKMNVEILINTVHSRNWIVNELVDFTNAANKISCEGDDINLGTKIKEESDKRFNFILPSLPTSVFEFERNQFFFEKLLEQSINLQRPFFKIPKIQKQNHCISLFIGAQSALRRWSLDYFAELILAIHKDYPDYYFQILGSPNDYENGEKIISSLEKVDLALIINNLCGQTSLIDLINRIGESHLLISNETSGVHIAAAVETQTVCIANGERFGRFSPYPVQISNCINTIFPDESFYFEENHKDYTHKFQYKSTIDINSITPEVVLPTIFSILKNDNN